MLPQAADNC